jgi:small-conductance mechanosensitive channel
MPRFADIDRDALLRFGGLTLDPAGVVVGLLIVLGAWVLSRLVTRALCRLRERSTRNAAPLYVLEKLASYGLIVVGAFAGLSAAGVNLSSLAVFAGALGIGVGLGLQGVVKEFVSGLFLIFDRMVSVGDYVEIGGAMSGTVKAEGMRGVIKEIGPRAVRVRTNDNVNVLVPNSRLIEQPVVNWTLKGDTRRIHIPFAVAYGADRAQVREAVLAAARASPFTLPDSDDRKSQVWLVGFGERGLEFELLVWPTREAVKRPSAMHAAYTWLIADALEAAGVETPVPQTDLRLRSVFGREGEAALAVLGLGDRATPPPASAPRPVHRSEAVNDAAEDVMAPAHPDEADDDEPRP